MITKLSNNSYKHIIGDIETEIGDVKQKDFKSQIKVKKWNNESNFSIRHVNFGIGGSLSDDGKKVKYRKSGIDTRFYYIEKDDRFFNDDGGFEFEVGFDSKPTSNIVEFTLQYKNCEFVYQPEPSDEEAKIELDSFITLLTNKKISKKIRDTFPTTLAEAKLFMRPEKVTGSYSVYHDSKRNNKYKTGKICQIYRPEVIDANGSRAWCELNISNDMMTVTIPQKFLDNAVYPLILDPDFGYTSVGASNATFADCHGHRLVGEQYTASSGDTITSYTLSAYSYGSAASFEIVAYSTSSNVPNARLTSAETVNFSASSAQWNTSSTVSHSLVAGTNYAIAYTAISGTVRIQYDSLTNAISNDTSAALPTIWTEASVGSARISMYATYTEAATGSTGTLNTISMVVDTTAATAESGSLEATLNTISAILDTTGVTASSGSISGSLNTIEVILDTTGMIATIGGGGSSTGTLNTIEVILDTTGVTASSGSLIAAINTIETILDVINATAESGSLVATIGAVEIVVDTTGMTVPGDAIVFGIYVDNVIVLVAEIDNVVVVPIPTIDNVIVLVAEIDNVEIIGD